MSRARIDEILESYEDLEYYEQIPLLEEAVTIADQLASVDLAWEMRMELLAACVFGGAPEKAIMQFAWLESTSENNPDRFPASHSNGRWLEATDLLWAYKWVLAELPGFAQVSRVHIEATLERMRTQYTRHQQSLRPYWMACIRNHIAFGDGRPAVQQALENFRTAPRDVYADCYACELNFLVETHLFLDEVDNALRVAQPLISGEEHCAEVPHLTYAALTIPTWRAGMKDQARLFHQRAYDLCQHNPDFLVAIATLIGFRLLEEDWKGAAALFEAHVSWAENTRSMERKLQFLLASWALAHRAPTDITLKTRSVLGPCGTPISSWKTRLEQEISTLTIAFDERNGNHSVTQRSDAYRALFQL